MASDFAGGRRAPGGSAGFSLTTSPAGSDDGVTVLVEGELDLATADELRRLLDTELSRRRAVKLDLSGVPFIDSTGLAAILAALRRSEEGRGELQIEGELQPQTRRMMELTGVLGLLEGGEGGEGD
ncbi:MAG TPA: STAS domain-containing protein [Solirubrobacteraceae bacterium]|nr:STAS domain-containing protein [Solirubrobacteraceae bacterium]